jgi:beta-glucuronidase
VVAATLAVALAAPDVARAQTSPYALAPPYAITSPYAARPPTKGALYRDGQTDRYLLGGTWLYRPDLGNQGLAQDWWRDTAATAGWSEVTVPNSYNAGDFSSTSMGGYVGWYRRDFTLPAGAFPSYVPASDRRWIIRFESVNYTATVWLNGRLIGTHAGAYLPFEFDLTGLRAGVNRLIVRVDDQRTAADLPPGPSGGWWNFGGINQEVYLRAVARADIQQVMVRPLLPCPSCAATIDEQALIRNLTGAPQTVHLTGRYGAQALDFGGATIAPHATWTASATAEIVHPDLWAPGHAALYRASLTLSDADGRDLGGYVTYSGIRSITLTAGGRIELNGRLLDLRGVNLHEQSIATGAALDPAQLAQLIGWVRELGADVIRAHYPLNPEIEELADRDGILIWSEIPVYQVSSQYLNQPGWVARAHAMLEENILTNQNHPSVLLWSIANELPTPPTAAEASYIAGAAALARELDPTRPVGMAISSWPGVPCQQAYAPLDVIGYNDYFGWYDADGGATDDRDALSPYLDFLRSCYPTKALLITEFGFEANRDGPVEERGTYEFQSNSIAYHLGVFATKPWLSGAIYFALQDFAVTPGWAGGNPLPDPPFNQKGLLDQYGNLKAAFPLVASSYEATMQIAPAPLKRARSRPASSGARAEREAR